MKEVVSSCKIFYYCNYLYSFYKQSTFYLMICKIAGFCSLCWSGSFLGIYLSCLVKSDKEGRAMRGSIISNTTNRITVAFQKSANGFYLLLEKYAADSSFKKVFDIVIMPLFKPNNFINAFFCTLSGVVIFYILQSIVLWRVRSLCYLAALLIITLLLSVFRIDYERIFKVSLAYRIIQGFRSIIIL